MKCILGLLMCIATALPLVGQMPNQVFLCNAGNMENVYFWTITGDRFSAQPEWTPSSGTLPLTINKAVEIAESWIESKNPELKSYAVSGIEIASQRNLGQERWFYKISFQPVIGGQRMNMMGNLGQFLAVVLLDGSIVEPRVQKIQQNSGGPPGMGVTGSQ